MSAKLFLSPFGGISDLMEFLTVMKVKGTNDMCGMMGASGSDEPTENHH